MAPGGRNYQPEAVTQQPITVGLSCGAVAGGSGVAEPNERSSLLPKVRRAPSRGPSDEGEAAGADGRGGGGGMCMQLKG